MANDTSKAHPFRDDSVTNLCADCNRNAFDAIHHWLEAYTPLNSRLDEMKAIQDATEILLKTNNQNVSGTLIVWKILKRAEFHLNNRMAELLGDDND